MNFAHLHLLLNHFPIIGSMIGTGLLVASLFSKNDDLRRSSLITFIGIALITIPTFLTGFGADFRIRVDPEMPEALIVRHEGAAMLSVWFMLATGAFSVVGLWEKFKTGQQKSWNLAVVMLLAFITVGLMARTGNTGGDIRHPEVQAHGVTQVTDDPMSAFIHKFEPNPDDFSALMIGSKWWWWIMMAAHFIGLALIVGTVGILDVRIMGFLKQIPVAAVHQFIPWALCGLAVNITTGMLAFIGQPTNYILSIGFWLKILGLLLLGVNAAVFYLTDIFGDVEKLQPGEDAAMPAKLVAASGLFLWFAVIALGRYIQPTSGTLRPS
jgi:uncharacterized membrane protein